MEYIVVLLLFVVVMQTRVMELRRSVVCLMIQSGLIASACIVVGLNHGLWHPLVPCLLTIGVKVIFIPGTMLRLIDKITDDREIFSNINVNYATLAAAAFLVLGYILAGRFLLAPIARDIFAATIMMIMTGLALMVMRRRAILQMWSYHAGKRDLPARPDYHAGPATRGGARCVPRRAHRGRRARHSDQPYEPVLYDHGYHGYEKVERVRQ